MCLQETIKDYKNAKQATKTALTKVSESKDMISSDKAVVSSCFFKFKQGSVVDYSKCLGMCGDVEHSIFCSNCRYKNKRIVYEQSLTELKDALKKELYTKRKLVECLKNVLVKSK